MKFVEKTLSIFTDRVSSILLLIMTYSLIIVSENEVIDTLCTAIGIIALVADIVWSVFIKSKKRTVVKSSKTEITIFIVYDILFILFFFILLPGHFALPSWTNTALLIILFGLLTFFALNNPGQVEETE